MIGKFKYLFLLFLLSLALPALAQDYANEYKVYNADRTLRLDYIEHEGDYTNLYISYTGTSDVGKYTPLILQDYKLVARGSGEEYRPVRSTIPSKVDNQLFFYNAGKGIQIKITFQRIPRHVKQFDLIEPTASTPATYNFTFRNLKFNEAEDVQWKISGWEIETRTPRYISIVPYLYNSLSIYADNVYVGEMNHTYTKGTMPDCDVNNFCRIVYPDDTERTISISYTAGNKKITRKFTGKPMLWCLKVVVE